MLQRKIIKFDMSRIWSGEIDRYDVIGLDVIYTTSEGEELIGVVEDEPRGVPARHLIARFRDGTWGRLDNVIRLIVDESITL